MKVKGGKKIVPPKGIKPQLCDSADGTDVRRAEAMVLCIGNIDAEHLKGEDNLTKNTHNLRNADKRIGEMVATRTVTKTNLGTKKKPPEMQITFD